MEKPFVVCHMLASLDGKIDGAFFGAPETAPALKAYGELRGFYDCHATLYGTTTMLGGYADGPAPALPEGGAGYPKEDYVNVDGRALGNYIVSVDSKGALGWHANTIEKKGRAKAHVIEVLTEQVTPAYLRYLRSFGISYLFAGKQTIDCALALHKLKKLFAIDRLMIAGGGTVNWSFLQEGLIDELSLVIAPVADGGTTAVSIFERADFLPAGQPVAFALKEAKAVDKDSLWLRYETKR
ncbi:MAG TPA: RibD family protein [Candidatus Gallacutalibacter stercoravium]|nr:RibD family protein [Candidatus Gallacutalibacter stercoravium]